MKVYKIYIQSCEDCPEYKNIPNDIDYCRKIQRNISNKNAIHPLCTLDEIK